jgi:hypothetical protein
MKSRLNAHYASTQERYDYVLVFGGVNDLYSDLTAHRTVAKIARDLESMYRSARNHGSKVLALTVAPWGGFRRYYNERRAVTTRELNEFVRQSPAAGRAELDRCVFAPAAVTGTPAMAAAPHRMASTGPASRAASPDARALGKTAVPLSRRRFNTPQGRDRCGNLRRRRGSVIGGNRGLSQQFAHGYTAANSGLQADSPHLAVASSDDRDGTSPNPFLHSVGASSTRR